MMYCIGDLVFSDRDIGLPVVMSVEQVFPVREQGGFQRIVGKDFRSFLFLAFITQFQDTDISVKGSSQES